MKLHLPVRLFRAVAALFSLGVGIASSCHISSAAVPEGYKEFIIVTEGDLTNMEPTLGNRAFLVKADLLFDKLSSPFMTGTAESWYFSGLSAMSIAFEKASYSAFYVADDQSLTFAEFREVDFSKNKVSISSDSAANSNAAGSAIYGADTIELSDNVSVVFSGNSASASSSNYTAYAWGGAVCGNTSTITLSKNKNLTFSGNTVSASSVRYYAYAWGSAIYGSVITLNENEDVTFSGNAASSSATLRNSARDSYAQGGAICGSTITLSKNKSLTFSENSAYASSSGNSSSYIAFAAGGVIYGDKESTITLSENESVVFSGNTVFSTSNSTNTATQALGGAIYGGSNSTITLSKNGSVEFSGNTVSTTTENYSTDNPAYGGAIYGGSNSTITLSNNESVTFSGNAASSTSLGSTTSGGAIYGGSQSTIELSNNEIVTFSENTASYLGSSHADLVSGGAIHGNKITLNGNGSVELCKNAVYNSSGKNASAKGGAIEGSSITLSENDRVLFSENSASSGFADGGAIFCTSLTVNNNEVVVFSKNTINSSYTTSGSSVITRGGAICVNRGTIMLRDNGKVEFSGNEVSSLALTACGGAIYGNYNSTITLRNNDSVEFRGNTVSSTSNYSCGGAIYGDYNSTITLRNNDSVKFRGNTVSSTSDYSFGGAIYGSTITLSMNGSVEFSGNTANGDGGAIYVLNGNSTVLLLSGNGSVTFNGNTASYGGGAIYAGNGSSIKLNENRSVTFSENTAYSGSAILASGNLSIRNNDFVLFEKNADVTNGTYRLRSISAGGSGDVISLSAAASGSIEFRDSVYIGSGSTVNLNADYTDDTGVVHKQTGDIIFTGKYTEAHLNELLAADGLSRTATEAEILNSRTTEVQAMTKLYGGRLRIEDGAVYAGYGITALEDSAATVLVKDAALKHQGYDLSFHAGTTLELAGNNSVSGNILMQGGSTLRFDIGETAGVSLLTGNLTFTEDANILVFNEANRIVENAVLLRIMDGTLSGWDTGTLNILDGAGNTADVCWVNGNLLVFNYNEENFKYFYLGDITHTTRLTGNVNLKYCNSISFENLSFSKGGAIEGGTIVLNSNESVTFSGNTASTSGGAIFGKGSTIKLRGNESVTFSGNSASYGGAIIGLSGSTIDLSDNGSVTFSGNQTRYEGAIHGDSDSTVTLSGNKSVTFSENTASTGGAIYGDSGSKIELSGNGIVTFSGNVSAYVSSTVAPVGGAIYGAGTVLLTSNEILEFRENEADKGGAIYGDSDSTIALCENGSVTFSGNAASSQGGAIYGYTDSTITLSENDSVLFSENTAKIGGAIYAYYNVALSGNGSVVFSGNSATSSYGGAISGYNSGTIKLSDNDTVTFIGNTATSGGAIYGSTSSTIKLSGNESVAFNANTATNHGGAIYGYSYSTIELSDNESVTFNANTATTAGGAIYGYGGSTIKLNGNESVTFSGNSVSDAGGAIFGGVKGSIELTGNRNVTFCKNTATSAGGAIDGSASIMLSGNGDLTFSENTTSGYGGAIHGRIISTIKLNGNESVTFSGNSATSGGAIYGNTNNTLELNDNGSVTFSGNSATSGGAIYGYTSSTIKLSGNKNVTFSGNSATSAGGAIYVDKKGNLSIRNNDTVLFEKNAQIKNGVYQLRSIHTNGNISLSAAASGSIEFRDSVYIAPGSTVDLNADYTDAEGVVHKQTGDIIFTGATTETDLLAVKGSAGTAEEIQNSRTSVMSTANLYGGRLRIEDGAILQVDNITVADDSYATVVLKDGTINGGLTIGATGTLYLSGENTIQQNSNYLTMAEGSCMQMNLGAVNIDGNAVLTINGLNTGNLTLHLVNSEYLATGDYKLIASTEACDISGWTLRGAEANQLTWENGTLYYKGGYDWNHVVKGGDEVRDSYAGNLIVNGGTVKLEKSVSVNAIDGVEKTGHLVINKGNLHVTAESNVRGDVMVKEGGALLNDGSIENCITLSGGKVSGSGVFAGIDMTGGKLVVGNSPGMQRYTDAVNLSGGTVVFSVAGAEAASAGNSGWGSGTYSTLDMQGNILTFGEDVTIEVAFGGEGLVSVLTATDANPYTLQMSLAQNVGNAADYTQEVLAALASQTTFVVTEEASGIAGCITLAAGQSLADIVKSYSYSMSGDTLVLSVTLAGNGKGVHAVPEPTTATLSLLALAALAARRRRK